MTVLNKQAERCQALCIFNFSFWDNASLCYARVVWYVPSSVVRGQRGLLTAGSSLWFPKAQAGDTSLFLSLFFSLFRLGRRQHHRPCHPELRGQQPYAFRPPLAFLGKIQPAGHFLSESLRDKAGMWPRLAFLWCCAWMEERGRARTGAWQREEGEETGLPKRRRRNGREARLASSRAWGWPASGQLDEPAGCYLVQLFWLQWWACLVAWTPAFIIMLCNICSGRERREWRR